MEVLVSGLKAMILSVIQHLLGLTEQTLHFLHGINTISLMTCFQVWVLVEAMIFQLS